VRRIDPNWLCKLWTLRAATYVGHPLAAQSAGLCATTSKPPVCVRFKPGCLKALAAMALKQVENKAVDKYLKPGKKGEVIKALRATNLPLELILDRVEVSFLRKDALSASVDAHCAAVRDTLPEQDRAAQAWQELQDLKARRTFGNYASPASPTRAGEGEVCVTAPAQVNSVLDLSADTLMHRFSAPSTIRDVPAAAIDPTTLFVNALCCRDSAACQGGCACAASGISVMLRSDTSSASFFNAHVKLVKVLVCEEFGRKPNVKGIGKLSAYLSDTPLATLQNALSEANIELPPCSVHQGNVPRFSTFYNDLLNDPTRDLHIHVLIQPTTPVPLCTLDCVATCRHPLGEWVPCHTMLKASAEVLDLIQRGPPDSIVGKLLSAFERREPALSAGVVASVAAETLQDYIECLIDELRPAAWENDLFDAIFYEEVLTNLQTPLSGLPIRMAHLLLAGVYSMCGPFSYHSYNDMRGAIMDALCLPLEKVTFEGRPNDEDGDSCPSAGSACADSVLIHGNTVAVYTDGCADVVEESRTVDLPGITKGHLNAITKWLQVSPEDRATARLYAESDNYRNALAFADSCTPCWTHLDLREHDSHSLLPENELAILLRQSNKEWVAQAASVTLLIPGLGTSAAARVAEILDKHADLADFLAEMMSAFFRDQAWHHHRIILPQLATRLLVVEPMVSPPQQQQVVVKPPTTLSDVFISVFSTERKDIGSRVGISLARVVATALDHLRGTAWHLEDSFMVAFVSDSQRWELKSTLLCINSKLTDDDADEWASSIEGVSKSFLKDHQISVDGTGQLYTEDRETKRFVLFTWSKSMFTLAAPAMARIIRRSGVLQDSDSPASLHLLNLGNLVLLPFVSP